MYKCTSFTKTTHVTHRHNYVLYSMIMPPAQPRWYCFQYYMCMFVSLSVNAVTIEPLEISSRTF